MSNQVLVLKARAPVRGTLQKVIPSATESAPQPRIIRRPEDLQEIRGWGSERWMGWKDKPGTILTGQVLPQKDLPERLYHVTSDMPGVQGKQMLLGQRDAGGFGGGQAEGVSFTRDRPMAEHLHREMLRMGRIARGEVPVSGFHTLAREDEQLHGLHAGALQHAVEYAQQRHDVNARSPVYDSPEKLRSLAKDSYNSYLIARDSALRDAGQPSKNPMFFTDAQTAAKWTPDRVGIVTVPKSAIPRGALTTSGSDDWLSEVRAYSDVPTHQAEYWPEARAPVEAEKPIWKYARHEYAPFPPQSPGPAPHTEQESAVFQDYLQRDRDWRRGVKAAISEGALHPEDARRQGFDESQFLDKVKPLPETLYHVTIGRSSVLKQGLKSRAEQGMRRGMGLGGGEDEGISLTESPETAQRIHDAMHEARGLLRGEIRPEDLLHQAATGQGAGRPWLPDMLRHSGSINVPQEETPSAPIGKDWREKLPPGWQAFLQGKTIRGTMQKEIPDSTGAMKVEDIQAKGYQPVGHMWRGGDGKMRAMHYIRPMTDDEKLDAHMQLYKLWSALREGAGGPEDPLFFLSDPKKLATTPKEDISILKVKPQPGARGVKMGALGEWRTYSGKALQPMEKSEGSKLVLEARGASRLSDGYTPFDPSDVSQLGSGPRSRDFSGATLVLSVSKSRRAPRIGEKFLRHENYSIITAENPHSKPAPPGENLRRLRQLHTELRSLGYDPIRATGHYAGQEEHAFLVPGLQQHHGHQLARKYGQSAWISRWAGGHRMFTSPTQYTQGSRVNIARPSPEAFSQVGRKRFTLAGWSKTASEGLVIRQYVIHTSEGDIPVELVFDPIPQDERRPMIVLRVQPSGVA